MPVPAPFLTGPQGAGKSTGGRMLVRIIEGMSGDLRRAPKDEENLIAAVAAGWVTALDNLSHMTPDLSDAMCCIVTGAESVKRALFTDGDVFRARYRRPLLLTGIDVGVIRPDLAERLLPLRLERPAVRRTEAELWAEYAEVLPVVLGSLLDLTVKVRAVDGGDPDRPAHGGLRPPVRAARRRHRPRSAAPPTGPAWTTSTTTSSRATCSRRPSSGTPRPSSRARRSG